MGTGVGFTLVITRVPNPITRRGAPINEIGIVIEILQAAFIGLTIAISVEANELEREPLK